ncbi:MAG TPA: hypothetical protein VFQ74_11005 [Pseudolysinimonas sp.]|nr:hypothetical protein [Pseudolysinimonas sp.]
MAVAAIREWLAQHPDTALRRITLVAFSRSAFDVVRAAIEDQRTG